MTWTMKPAAGALLALLVPLCFGCGHSAAAAHRTRVAPRLLPGAIAFWDDRHGLALFGPSSKRKAQWSDELESTSDGGRTWQRLRSVPNGSRILVAGLSRAWLVTRGGLSRSDDRGVKWQRISRYPLLDVSFATGREGLGYGVRGGHEVLAETVDEGRSWHRLRFPCGDDGAVDGDDVVSLGAPNAAWVLCVNEPGAGSQRKWLYESDDGGWTWHRRSASGVGYLAGLSFRGSARGWLWEHRGSFLRTDDGGRTWSALAIGQPEQAEAESASFYAGDGGLALMHDVRNGAVLRLVRTADGGQSWQEIRTWPVRTWPAL
jgi:photosystem II stability/assembly factor-like uncharacterized protein